jgi:hypothetical protein
MAKGDLPVFYEKIYDAKLREYLKITGAVAGKNYV